MLRLAMNIIDSSLNRSNPLSSPGYGPGFLTTSCLRLLMKAVNSLNVSLCYITKFDLALGTMHSFTAFQVSRAYKPLVLFSLVPSSFSVLHTEKIGEPENLANRLFTVLTILHLSAFMLCTLNW